MLHEGWRPVSLSKLDKAPQIELDKTLSTATSRKGYRMVGIVYQCHVIVFHQPLPCRRPDGCSCAGKGNAWCL